MSYGLKISEVGYDVKTANDENLVFSSEYPLMLADIVSDFNIDTSVNGGVVNIAHNYGYVPVFMAQSEGHTTPDYIGSVISILRARANSGTINFTIDSSFADNFDVKLYIFRNKVS